MLPCSGCRRAVYITKEQLITQTLYAIMRRIRHNDSVQMAVIVKINFLYIKKPYAYLHYTPNMFTKYKNNPSKTVGVDGYDYAL